MRLPESFVLNKLYSYSYEPTYNKFTNTYNAGCPICKEGKSLGKKKRLFYYPETNTFHCFNCSKSWSAYNWVINACNMSSEDIEEEVSTNSFSTDIGNRPMRSSFKKSLPDLPYDSINIFDPLQQQFYLNNKKFSEAFNYVKKRLLDQAVNKSPNLFISLTDFVHKNRICIPFYSLDGKIVFYQSRSIDATIPKYLGKHGYEKTLFGMERISIDIPYIFIFEGPIDAMFVKNGVAAAGINLTDVQKSQLLNFPFHKIIWVLDNPRFDETANRKTTELVMNRQKVFRWTDDMPYKDFNEMCTKKNIFEIDYNIIIENTF